MCGKHIACGNVYILLLLLYHCDTGASQQVIVLYANVRYNHCVKRQVLYGQQAILMQNVRMIYQYNVPLI